MNNEKPGVKAEAEVAPPTPSWGADERTRLRVARTVTDPAELAQLAEDIMQGRVCDDGVLTEELLFNLNIPLVTALRLVAFWQGVNNFRYQICCRPDATPEFLDASCADWDTVITDKVAAHPNTTLETLNKLSLSENPMVVASAIANPRFPPGLLEPFLKNVPGVRMVVARRIEDLSILEKLAFDEFSEVREAAMENPHTRAALANQVARTDKDMTVVVKAVAKVDDPALLDELAKKCTHADQELIRAIAKNPHSSDTAKTWMVLIR